MPQNTLDTVNFSAGEGYVNNDALPTDNANWVLSGSSDADNVRVRGIPGVGQGGGGNSCCYRTGQTWTNDQWAQLTVDATNLVDTLFGRWAVVLRGVAGTATNCYALGAFPSIVDNTLKYRIGRFDGMGTFTTLETSATTMATSDVVNAQIVGTVLTLTVNSVVLLTHDTASIPDATQYTTGNPGLLFNSNTATNRYAGSWLAGSVTSGGLFTSTNPMTGLGVGGHFFANPLG